MFLGLRPSQIWIIVLGLLNKTNLKNLINIPTMFLLFSSMFSESSELIRSEKMLSAKFKDIGLDPEKNELDNFFWSIIILAIIRRFLNGIFKFLWLPFKLAMIIYLLKYFGVDFSYLFKILNTLSLGIIGWFYDKLIEFIELFKNND